MLLSCILPCAGVDLYGRGVISRMRRDSIWTSALTHDNHFVVSQFSQLVLEQPRSTSLLNKYLLAGVRGQIVAAPAAVTILAGTRVCETGATLENRSAGLSRWESLGALSILVLEISGAEGSVTTDWSRNLTIPSAAKASRAATLSKARTHCHAAYATNQQVVIARCHRSCRCRQVWVGSRVTAMSVV